MKLENKKMIMTLVFSLLLILGSIGDIVYLTAMNEFLPKTFSILSIFTLVAAVAYFFTDFQKSSAKYFKLFIYLFILYEYTSALNFIMEFNKGKDISFILEACIHPAIFFILNVLMFKKDLGKKLSNMLSLIVLIAQLLILVVVLIEKAFNDVIIFKCLSQILIALVLVIMQQMKYIDKTQRKTK